MTFLTNLTYLGFGTLSILAMIPIIGNQRTHLELTQAKLKKRLELGTPRNDLIEGLLERGKNAVSCNWENELREDERVLIITLESRHATT